MARRRRFWSAGIALLACQACGLAAGDRANRGLPLRGEVLGLFDRGRPFTPRITGQDQHLECVLTDSVRLVPPLACRRSGAEPLAANAAALAPRVAGVVNSTSSLDGIWSAGLLDLWSSANDERAVDRAIARMAEVVARDSSMRAADALNDLAAAHLVRASLRDDPRDLFTALQYIEQAFATDSADEVIRFNRALALEAAGLDLQAVSAWKALADSSTGWGREAWLHYRDLDHQRGTATTSAAADSAPAEFARRLVENDPQRARELVLDSLAPQWAELTRTGGRQAHAVAVRAEQIGAALVAKSGDSSALHVAHELRDDVSLANAVAAATAGAASYRQTRYEEAQSQIETASKELRRGRADALADWSDLVLGGTAIYRGDYVAAERTFGAIGSRAHARHDVALEARANWGLALSRARRGAMSAVEPVYRIAANDFERIGESSNYAFMQALIADIHAALGQTEVAARDGYLALRSFHRHGDPGQRYAALLALGHRLSEEGKTRAAAAAVREATIEAQRTGRTKDIPESLARLATVEAELGAGEAANRAAVAARAGLGSVTDSVMHARIEAEVARAEARVHQDDRPFAIERLDRVGAYFRQAGIPSDEAATLVQSASLRLDAGDSSTAERDLNRATDLVHRFVTASASAEMSRQLAVTQRDAYHQLIEVALARGDTGRAYTYTERARAFGGSRTDEQTASTVRRGSAILEYVVLNDRTLIWVSTESRRQLVASRVGGSEITRWTARLVSLIRQGEDSLAERDVEARLYRALLAPVSSILDAAKVGRVEIVADGPTDDVPFAALRDSSSRFAGRRYAMSYAFAPVVATDEKLAQNVSALFIGDPDWDRSRFPDLGELRATAGEVRAASALYRAPTVLVGGDASRRTLINEIARHDVMHFAGHARVLADNPAASHLVLARDSASFQANVLYASEIAALDLRRLRLVVLSACGETRGPFMRQQGNGLVQAFLDAGANAVVASSWEADDEATAALTRRFHELSRAGVPADEALQRAQIALMDGDAASMAPRRMWAGFRYYVGGKK